MRILLQGIVIVMRPHVQPIGVSRHFGNQADRIAHVIQHARRKDQVVHLVRIFEKADKVPANEVNPVKPEQLFYDQALEIRASISLNRRDGSRPMLLQDVAVRAFQRPKLQHSLTLTPA